MKNIGDRDDYEPFTFKYIKMDEDKRQKLDIILPKIKELITRKMEYSIQELQSFEIIDDDNVKQNDTEREANTTGNTYLCGTTFLRVDNETSTLSFAITKEANITYSNAFLLIQEI